MAARYLRIMGYEDDVDLRTVSARTTRLRSIARKYKLQDLGVVVFTNRVRTRFRLVLQIRGLVLVCSPEVEMSSKNKYSMYLRVSDALARLGGLTSDVVELKKVGEYTEQRIARIRKRRRNQQLQQKAPPP